MGPNGSPLAWVIELNLTALVLVRMGWRMRPVFRLLQLRFLTVQCYIFCFDLRLLALSIFWKFVQSFSLNHSLLLFDLIVICSFVTFYTVQSNSLLQIYFSMQGFVFWVITKCVVTFINFPGLSRATGRTRVVGTYRIAPIAITPSASVTISRTSRSWCLFQGTQ